MKNFGELAEMELVVICLVSYIAIHMNLSVEGDLLQETCQGHFESPVLSNSLSTFVNKGRHNPAIFGLKAINFEFSMQ